MGLTTVVMVYEETEGGLEITSSKDEDAIEALTPSVPTNRSANAFARGAWIGVRMILNPSERNTSSSLRRTWHRGHG